MDWECAMTLGSKFGYTTCARELVSVDLDQELELMKCDGKDDG